MRKIKAPEQVVDKHRADILREIRRWKAVKENGCNDPFWPDGTNMNLIRNHIIFAKRRLLDVCIENNIPVPEEYYMPTPPVVDDDYMANLKQKERVKRLREMNAQLKTDKPSYLENQMSLL